ncbi:outer membrane protein OmpA-like peptidoglycan-associated protein [Streptosporangium album]|uniref:Outer membrane protein OmpA-like peptidoglycan-associated protein n=1 Tax=Streptosporangium album TaxID=47479 RepID=A0A7W7RS43_9ACTN|nr:OmpA family protein [Streptosporangium album]MBB4937187.1 outer membrane protein OmpA-like peptidoglycan-associated protein [Streptosporangium album]
MARKPASLVTMTVVTAMLTSCGLTGVQQGGGGEERQSEAAPTSRPTAPETPAASSSPTGTGADTRPALASTRSTLTPAFKVDVVGLNRVAGKHLVVQLRLSNTGTDKHFSWTGELGDNTRPLGEIRWASGIGVLDAAARRWLLPYKPADGPCLCSDQKRDDLGYFVEPGESLPVYAVLPAPSGNPATTTVVTPLGPPMVDVPISDEPVAPLPGQDIPDPDAQPVTMISHRIVTPSESPDRSEETTDDGRDLRVNLSSDVLFALNKADLTSRARAVLARTAKLVDASEGATVTVEGHADSSGTDAINDPLSQRRAQAVQRALSGLLTRQGVRFQAKGYGSRRPLYSNDDEEGRRRNRRVTVTFARPQPAETRPPSTPEADPAPDGNGPTSRAKYDGQPFTLQAAGLRRLPGDLGVLTYEVTNDGDEEAWNHELNWSAEWLSYKYHAASNVRLTDVATRRLYLPGRILAQTDDGTDTYCACSGMAGVRLSAGKFAPGQTKEFWSLFALPAGVSETQVKIAEYPPLRVPVR